MRAQGPGAPADGVRGYQAHGAGRVRVRVRGRARAPPQPRVAQHLRDVAASRAGVHGRRRRHAGRAGAHQDPAVRLTSTYELR